MPIGAGVSIITTPGLLTDQATVDVAAAAAHGYQWVAYQVVNPRDPAKPLVRDLGPAKSAGLSAGVWGVTYGAGDRPDAASFFRDGRELGEQAVKMGAQHVQVDAEMCAKDTRANRGLKPIINGVRAGGWTGAVHLCTLGAPDNPDTNDYAIDVQSFTDTGGGILAQAYANEHSGYRPDLCARYWARVNPGVPLNIMIALYSGALGRISGSGWAPMLQQAAVKRNFSIFMAEHVQPGDLDGLDPYSRQPAPVPSTAALVADTKKRMIELALAMEAEWKRVGRSQTQIDNSRIKIARAILQSSDTAWTGARAGIKLLLDL